jgi:hypothetical protein
MHRCVERVVRASDAPNAMQQRRDFIPDFRASGADLSLLRTEKRIRRRRHNRNRVRQSPMISLISGFTGGRLLARSSGRACFRRATRATLLS